MTPRYEAPSLEELVAEQAAVQAKKFQGRQLAEYSSYMFPGQDMQEPLGSAVVDFVRPLIGSDKRASLEGLLEGTLEAKQTEPVNWVDMGGGRSLAMRQIACIPFFKNKLKMTNVDLFNFGINGLGVEELAYLEALVPGMTLPSAAPHVLLDNAETVTLPEPADIITSIETIQYINDPLTAISSWYNQLSPNGIMFVATEHDWASWIRYNNTLLHTERRHTPIKQLIQELTKANITYAATDRCDWQNGFRPEVNPNFVRILAIQKKPGTMLRIAAPVTKVWVSPDRYKVTYYEAPTDESCPTVEVIRTNTTISVGALTLKDFC